MSARVERACPKCGGAVELPGAPGAVGACRRCAAAVSLLAATAGETSPGACLACGCADLYRQKDFPRKVGLAVVAAAALAVFVAVARSLPVWAIYAPLLGAAALDAGLYLALPEIVVCYRCRAKHRGFLRSPRREPFDPAIHDRYAFAKPAERTG